MEVLREFKSQLIIFFDELIENFPEEGDLVIARLFIANQVPIVDLMNDFNHHINKDNKRIRKMIKDRREDFFLHNTLFNSHKTNLNHFKKLWRSGILDKDDKEIIWKWVDTFIFLGDKYSRAIATPAVNK
jgi:predicted KAP-like P-loop ATPase|tara:strand:- start:8476 stop:8865 length:390 start_codon:yes stop_codon:yes gene_type:complete